MIEKFKTSNVNISDPEKEIVKVLVWTAYLGMYRALQERRNLKIQVLVNISGLSTSRLLKESDLCISIIEVLGQWDPQGLKETLPRACQGAELERISKWQRLLFGDILIWWQTQILLLVVLTKSEFFCSEIKVATLSPQSQMCSHPTFYGHS